VTAILHTFLAKLSPPFFTGRKLRSLQV